MKRQTAILLLCAILMGLALTGCRDSGYSKYHSHFIDTFDTMVEIIGYAKTDEEFNRYTDLIHQDMLLYHKYFDKYHSYEGIANIKTINDQAGIAPVAVDQPIIDLLLLSKEWYGKTGGAVNVAFGPVLSIWHDYRERYQNDPEGARLPPMEELEAAATLTDIDKVIIDQEAGTVFLAEVGMSLDVGAVAKGYATELAGSHAYQEGFTSYMISSGGNVRIYDPPSIPRRSVGGWGFRTPVRKTFSAVSSGIWIPSFSIRARWSPAATTSGTTWWRARESTISSTPPP